MSEDIRINVRISRELRERLERERATRGINVSQCARDALLDYFERRDARRSVP